MRRLCQHDWLRLVDYPLRLQKQIGLWEKPSLRCSDLHPRVRLWNLLRPESFHRVQ